MTACWHCRRHLDLIFSFLSFCFVLQFEAYAKAKHAEAEAFVRDQLTAAKSVLDKEFQEAARQAKQEIENEAEAKYSQKAKKEIAQALDQMGNEAEARVKVSLLAS